MVCASTKGEGLTGALREALAMERPVVSTAVAGNVEIVRDEETGRLVPPNDPMRLADAIGFMLSHAERARQMASAGRRWVLENCDERKRAQQVEAIYREILARLPAKG